jgi:nucleotide-binding universal stress UspA family protein
MNSIRMAVAVHGYEPEGWAREVPRTIAAHGPVLLRVLLVEDPPPVAFTSLLPVARRRYGAALAAARHLGHDALQATVTEILTSLPSRPEVLSVPARGSDAGRAIVEHAAQWPADVIIVGRDTRSRLHRAALGTVHERVVRLASCAVLVTPAPPPATSRLHRVRSIGPAASVEGHA